jgi:hypothetical protein
LEKEEIAMSSRCRPPIATLKERDLLGDDLVPDFLTSVNETDSTAGPILTLARTKTRGKKANDLISLKHSPIKASVF